MNSLELDYKRIDELKLTLNDNHYVEYIWHRFFDPDDPTRFDECVPNTPIWQYPEDWLSRYHLYYDQFGYLLKDAEILDIGANFNFYNTWAMLAGAKSVEYLEPNTRAFELGKEYLSIRNTNNVHGDCVDIDTWMARPEHKTYDVVFLLDMLYYTTNHLEIFKFLKNTIKPTTIFFETSTMPDDDAHPNGQVELWYPKGLMKFENEELNVDNSVAHNPSRKFLFNIIAEAGFTIEAMYDYKNYKGNGESRPRMDGEKVFMILK